MNRIRKIISAITGFIAILSLMIVLILWTSQSSFGQKSLERQLDVHVLQMLQNEMIVSANEVLDDVNLDKKIDENCLSIDRVKSLLVSFDADQQAEIEELIKLHIISEYDQKEWQYKIENIEVLSEMCSERIVEKAENHLIHLIVEISKESEKIVKLGLLISSVLSALMIIVTGVLHSRRLVGVFETLCVLVFVLNGVLQGAWTKRIVIGYGIESAYLLFQNCMNHFKSLWYILMFVLCGCTLLIVLFEFFREKKSKI